MRNREVEGTYGSGKTPCTVFVYENYRGSRWYAVEGSTGVNCTYDDIEEGVDVEVLSDHDFFTSSFEINSLEELEKAVEE